MPMKLREKVDLKTDQERVDYLANLVEEGSEDPVIREFTVKLLRASGCKSYDYECEVKTIFGWVRDNIRYVRHVLCRDAYTTARRVLELRSGDCDNSSVLLNSMLASVGFPVGFRLVSSRPDRPFHHIYSLVGLPPSRPTRWVPLDATEKSAYVGWEPKYAKKKDFVIVCGA